MFNGLSETNPITSLAHQWVKPRTADALHHSAHCNKALAQLFRVCKSLRTGTLIMVVMLVHHWGFVISASFSVFPSSEPVCQSSSEGRQWILLGDLVNIVTFSITPLANLSQISWYSLFAWQTLVIWMSLKPSEMFNHYSNRTLLEDMQMPAKAIKTRPVTRTNQLLIHDVMF